MGFSRALVSKALEESDEENSEAVVETLLNYSPWQQEVEISIGKNKKIMFLVEMGYNEDEASVAAKRCGEDATIAEIQDAILAAQVAKKYEGGSDVQQRDKDYKSPENDLPKRKSEWVQEKRVHIQRESVKKMKEIDEKDGVSRLPPHRIGFGVPNDPTIHNMCREIPDAAVGPPFFYYENVAMTCTKNSGGTISQCLYHIKPEFIDSKDQICAVASTRGYIHNLPINDRFRLEPQAPLTIQEALPHTKNWWPSWDMRTQLIDIQGNVAGSNVADKIRVCLSRSSHHPPPDVQRFVLHECKKWNLVWVGFHKLSSLEPDEMEMLMGFPKNHTRGGGMSGRDRYKCLGNSFQVDTLAYHLSALKNMFPNGIRVLSLFSGIGAAELSLHRLGIPLKVVVSVELSEGNRDILRGWWEQTDQKGTLIDMTDIRDLTCEKLERLISSFGGFDLVIGGSPCNNLSGSNRRRGDGLAGDQSSLFYDFFRVLDDVMRLTKKY